MPVAHLADRALIDVSGPDAEHFLQNILTIDLTTVEAGQARPGALLAPQGKILFDFLVSRADGGFRLELRQDLAADFMRRLTLYRLRAKAEIRESDQHVVAVSWGTDSGSSQTDSTIVSDMRFPAALHARRHYGELPAADAAPADWRALRISHGIAESGDDYAAGDAFPHDVLLDQNGGVGFRKGCYIGQEVVSRMQHRGTARRRVLLVSADKPLPPAGTTITANGRPIGALGSVSGTSGLAILRIDRVKDAMDSGTPLLADGIALGASIPDWANFSFPEAASTTDND
ncbi:MAG TPA: folate-binding protein YgfZ [Rhizobiaceae bacterium]|nr:folate-binding protein YgfZ [Rhizobiaceae bacterium]